MRLEEATACSNEIFLIASVEAESFSRIVLPRGVDGRITTEHYECPAATFRLVPFAQSLRSSVVV
jgi:hypothetical protein